MMAKAVTPLADVLQGTRKNVINVHTSYYESFFLLSVDVWVDGCPLQLEGCNQSNLGLHSPIDNITIPFKALVGAVSKAAERFGVHQLARVRCGSCPLFEVDFTTKKTAMKFCKALAAGRVQDAMLESIAFLVKSDLDSCRLSVCNKLLFITPKSARNDTLLREVTKANCSECFELLCEGMAFDFGDLVRHSRLESHASKEIQLSTLMKELEAVVHWFSLGVYLNVPTHELERLKLIYGYRKEGMIEMLVTWLKTGESSYSVLVDALVAVGILSLARKIAVKYGIITAVLSHGDSKNGDVMHLQNAASATPGYASALKETRLQVVSADFRMCQLQRDISRTETLRFEMEERFKHTKLSIKQVTKSLEQLNKELLGLRDQRNKKEQQKEWLVAQMTTQEQTMQMPAAIQILQETAIFIEQLNHQIEEVESTVYRQKTEVESMQLKLIEQETETASLIKQVSELQLNSKKVDTALQLERKHFDLQMQQMMAAQKSSKDLQRELQNQTSLLRDELTQQRKEIDVIMKQSNKENESKVREEQLSISNTTVTFLLKQIDSLQLQLTVFRKARSPKLAHKDLTDEHGGSDAKKQPATFPFEESGKTNGYNRSPTASPEYPGKDSLASNTFKVSLRKVKQQLGFSLTGGERVGRMIRIHSVAAEGLASQDGRLREGDVLVNINGESVLGSQRELAVAILESIPINTDIEFEVYRSESTGQQKSKTKLRAKRSQEHVVAAKTSIKAFTIMKSLTGFGFSIGDSTEGIIVKQILDKERCGCLREGDIIVAVSSGLGHQPLTQTYTVAKLVQYLKRIDIGTKATFHISRLASAVPSVPKSHEPTALPDVAAPYCVPVQSVDTTTSPSQPGQYNKLQHHEPTALPRVAVPYCVPVQNADVSSPLLQPNQYHKLQHVFNRHLSSSSMPCLCREVLLSTQPSAGFGFRIRGGREEGFIPTVVSVTPGEAADNAGLSVGDQIISVNGQQVTDASYNDVVKLIKEAAINGHVTLSIDSS